MVSGVGALSAKQFQKSLLLAKSRHKARLNFGLQILLVNTPKESADSARDVHSLDSPAILPAESGLQVPF